jgi:PAS domain-containing protein
VAKRRPKHLALILAREFASTLATPTLIADERGWMIYFNEAAEGVIGRTFDEVGEVPVDAWTATFAPRTNDTQPFPLKSLPVMVALETGKAAHERFVVTSRDGVERSVSVSAFPLFAHENELVGIVSMFWRD